MNLLTLSFLRLLIVTTSEESIRLDTLRIKRMMRKCNEITESCAEVHNMLNAMLLRTVKGD